MSKFKPGDLAIITNANSLKRNIGAVCELVMRVMPGETYVNPVDGCKYAYGDGYGPAWVVSGDSIVGRAWSYGVAEDTPGSTLAIEKWLMPLRGDFDFAKERDQEAVQ